MAQVNSISQPLARNWQQTVAIPHVDERSQQQGQQHQHDQDRRYHIPEDEQEFQIDEYV